MEPKINSTYGDIKVASVQNGKHRTGYSIRTDKRMSQSRLLYSAWRPTARAVMGQTRVGLQDGSQTRSIKKQKLTKSRKLCAGYNLQTSTTKEKGIENSVQDRSLGTPNQRDPASIILHQICSCLSATFTLSSTRVAWTDEIHCREHSSRPSRTEWVYV